VTAALSCVLLLSLEIKKRPVIPEPVLDDQSNRDTDLVSVVHRRADTPSFRFRVPLAPPLNRRHFHRLSEPPENQILPIAAWIPMTCKYLDLVLPQDFPNSKVGQPFPNPLESPLPFSVAFPWHSRSFLRHATAFCCRVRFAQPAEPAWFAKKLA